MWKVQRKVALQYIPLWIFISGEASTETFSLLSAHKSIRSFIGALALHLSITLHLDISKLSPFTLLKVCVIPLLASRQSLGLLCLTGNHLHQGQATRVSNEHTPSLYPRSTVSILNSTTIFSFGLPSSSIVSPALIL
jgi:hypothetical protein